LPESLVQRLRPEGGPERHTGWQPVLRQASEGLPMPRRRTFAAGILPYALSMLPPLRHPGCASEATPAPGARTAPRSP